MNTRRWTGYACALIATLLCTLAGLAMQARFDIVNIAMVYLLAVVVIALLFYPMLGVAFFPRTDAGQFVMNIKLASGSRIEMTAADIARVERLVRCRRGMRVTGRFVE